MITLSTTAIALVTPQILGNFLDVLVSGGDLVYVLRFCAVFGGLSILRIILGYAASVIYVKIQTKAGYDLNMDAIKHVQNASLSYSEKQDAAYLNQRINNDANNLIIFCITILQNVMTNAVMLIVPFVVLIHMNWMIALLLMIFLVVYILSYSIFKKPLYKANFAFKEAQSKFFAHMYDQFKYIKLIKINSIQSEINQRADISFDGLFFSAVRKQKISHLYSGLDGFITTLAQITLFVVGGIQILSGNFTIGMFTIFSSYFNMMLGAGRYFFNLGANYQNTLVAYNRIEEVFEQRLESYGNIAVNDIQKIEIENISFSYANKTLLDQKCDTESLIAPKNPNTTNENILNNFSTTFEKGKIYCISGENGTGKSTLISLIMGMYINEIEGSIRFNGVNIKEIDMPKIRRTLFGFAEQEPTLINDTIWYNLTFEEATDGYESNKHDVKYESLTTPLQTLNMTDFIEKNTLNLIINDKNSNTSGGEKQKIAILKVLTKDSPVMIFDEPASALDAQTNDRFMRYLQQAKRGKIIILISHDEEVKRLCDEVVRL